MLPTHLLNAMPIYAAQHEITEMLHSLKGFGIANDSVQLLSRALSILDARIKAARDAQTLLTVTQYADLVGLTPAAVRYQIRAGTLAALRYGKHWRIPLSMGGGQ